MAAVQVYVDTIDGTPMVQPNPVDVSGAGPWKVRGRAIASQGFSIVYLAWSYDLTQPANGISLAALPNCRAWYSADRDTGVEQAFGSG